MSQDRARQASGRPAPSRWPMPGPRTVERPTAYADRIGEWCIRQKTDRQRKDHGVFLTPAPVADFMAGRITSEAHEIRVLDPAAGAGILCCAARGAPCLPPGEASDRQADCPPKSTATCFHRSGLSSTIWPTGAAGAME